MISAAIYLRISRDDLATGLAVERQREDCLKILASRGWELHGEYVDNAISASKRNVSRPNYDRMEADYAAGRFSALVCYDLDRLTRQPRQLEDWIDAAEDRGLVIVTANGEADLSTDNGRLFARIKASVARSEIERKGARQKRANLQRAQSGRPVPTRRRYGYETDGITSRAVEAAVVRDLFDKFAAGASIRSLAKGLAASGVDPAPGISWPTSRVRYILASPFYGGRARHNGIETESSTIVPIVPPELSDFVRAILADDSRRTTTGPKPSHLLSGIARCAAEGCNRPLHHLRTYACPEATAGHISILTATLENRVLDEIATAILTGGPDLFEGSGDRAEVVRLVNQLDRNDMAATATSRDRDEGLLSDQAARSRLLELRDRRLEAEDALSRARMETAVSSTLVESAQTLLVGDVMTMSEWADAKGIVIERLRALPIERQREVTRALVHVEVAPGRDPRTRIHIEHLIVTSLNPDSLDGVDFDAE
jgi:site-specific DNA recombinase